MHIQFNTDNNIEGSQDLAQRHTTNLETSLRRFEDRITRIELYLSDVSGKKSGQNDKRCVLEARLNGLDPIAVTHQADTIDFAVDGATDKLQNALDNKLGKLRTY